MRKRKIPKGALNGVLTNALHGPAGGPIDERGKSFFFDAVGSNKA
jgi:hypothetical protein